MPRMSKRNKREWGLFINPKTGRKNYNDLCRKCLRRCKQSYRVIVISCRRFTPNWGRKSTPDSPENEESEEPMQQHQPPNKRRLGRKETDKIDPNMPIIDRGAPYNGPKTKPAKGCSVENPPIWVYFDPQIHPFGRCSTL